MLIMSTKASQLSKFLTFAQQNYFFKEKLSSLVKLSDDNRRTDNGENG
jgi:hypothetical protein